jgi:proline iminopeptidase
MRFHHLVSTSLILVGTGPLQSAGTGFIVAPDGVRLYYEVHGSGPDTIVAVHGGPGETLANLYPVLQPLSRGHGLILYDQRGNGRSSDVPDSTRLTIRDHVADLELVRAHFGLERGTFLGHSWGGDLVALYSAAHPDRVARLILVDPGPPREDPFDRQSRAGRMAGFDSAGLAKFRTLAGAVLADTAHDRAALCRTFYQFYLRNYYVDPARMKRAVAIDCAYPGYSIKRANRVSRFTEASGYEGRRWDTLVTRVRVPVLVVHGNRDFIPVASSETWARAFPDGRLLVIEGSSHSPFEDRPDRFFPAALEFLRGGWPKLARRPTVPAQ